MIIIIGNGISGVTAARYIRKRSDEEIMIISAESKYFFSRTALMYVYMGHMKFEHTQPYEPYFWDKNRIQLKEARINKVDTEKKQLITDNGEKIDYDKLIIATGSKPNKFGWKGQDSIGVQGLYSKQDLELMERNTTGIKNAVVVGGGLIGIEMAEMLLTRGIKVDFLVRESHFWNSVLPKQDAELIMRHLTKHHGLTMHYSTELDEIHPDQNGRVESITTKSGNKIDCQFVGLTAGVSPNVDFLKDAGIEINRGILVNEYLETSVKDVYAIGDCAEFRQPIEGRRPVEQVWYTGKFMGETVAYTLTGEKRKYQPGHWFNSAKFFEIEYQTYGLVKNKLDENHSEFVFEDSENEILLHFVFEKKTEKFIGINNFGIRLRHPLFNEWLNSEATIDEVISNLASANFDPEFYKKYEPQVIEAFNHKFNKNLTLSKGKWWQKLIPA